MKSAYVLWDKLSQNNDLLYHLYIKRRMERQKPSTRLYILFERMRTILRNYKSIVPAYVEHKLNHGQG